MLLYILSTFQKLKGGVLKNFPSKYNFSYVTIFQIRVTLQDLLVYTVTPPPEGGKDQKFKHHKTEVRASGWKQYHPTRPIIHRGTITLSC